MTLQDLFNYINQHPLGLVWFLLSIPLLVFVVSLWQDRSISPDLSISKYAYSILAYLACIPGIFAITLNTYLFLFERQSVWTANLVVQFLPILTMAISLIIIKKSMPFEFIPHFGKLPSFMTIIAAGMGIMWFIDRMRIYAVTYIPFHYIAIAFIGLLLLIRFAWSKIF